MTRDRREWVVIGVALIFLFLVAVLINWATGSGIFANQILVLPEPKVTCQSMAVFPPDIEICKF